MGGQVWDFGIPRLTLVKKEYLTDRGESREVSLKWVFSSRVEVYKRAGNLNVKV